MIKTEQWVQKQKQDEGEARCEQDERHKPHQSPVARLRVFPHSFALAGCHARQAGD